MRSANGLRFQVSAFANELLEFSHEDYPAETLAIRDLFLAFANFALAELDSLDDAVAREQARMGGRSQSTEDAHRAQSLVHVIHQLFSYIRFLRASSPLRSPPGLRKALDHLVREFFPLDDQEPISIVRPQWKYNLKCVTLHWDLQRLISKSLMDPEGELNIDGAEDFLDFVWREYRSPDSQLEDQSETLERPKHIGVFSFAGLDRDDVLLYPMLAHEVGHFIDFSFIAPGPRSRLSPLDRVDTLVEEETKERLRMVAGGREPDEDELQRAVGPLLGATQVCLRELFADMLAIRMMGFSYFAALNEFLDRTHSWPEAVVLTEGRPRGYPGRAFRLAVILRHLKAMGIGDEIEALTGAEDEGTREVLGALNEYIEKWEREIRIVWPDYPDLESIIGGGPSTLRLIPQRVIVQMLGELEEVAKDLVPRTGDARLTRPVLERVKMLSSDLPPWLSGDGSASFPEIMNSMWLFQIGVGDRLEESASDQLEVRHRTGRLVSKALELMDHEFSTISPTGSGSSIKAEDKGKDGILAKGALLQRITEGPIDQTIGIGFVPFRQDLVQGSSVDVRLGHHFATIRRPKSAFLSLGVPLVDAAIRNQSEELERHFVPSDGSFVIHPGSLVLGTTLEFIAVPSDLMAFVEGRSSMGRRGLLVATAASVAPGFHGVLILELVNAGTVPLVVKPGVEIAQLVFHTVSHTLPNDELYRGQYYCQIRP